MSQPGPLLVTAHLCSPLAGDPPGLDSLLVKGLMQALPAIERRLGLRAPPYRGGLRLGMEMGREVPVPRAGESESAYTARFLAAYPEARGRDVLLANAGTFWDWFTRGWRASPLAYGELAGWPVARCSDPILPVPGAETVEYVAKRIAVECAPLLAEGERRVVSTTNSWTKSYRLPLRVRAVPCVRWLAFGDARETRKLLKGVGALGKKISDGYGRVRCWSIEHAAADLSWYAPHERGTVLMRTLPGGPHLPKSLVGFRKDYRAVRDPYWHPDVCTEVVTPC